MDYLLLGHFMGYPFAAGQENKMSDTDFKKREDNMRVRRLQRKDEDGVWYDDAYAFENGKQPVTFRYNLILGMAIK